MNMYVTFETPQICSL